MLDDIKKSDLWLWYVLGLSFFHVSKKRQLSFVWEVFLMFMIGIVSLQSLRQTS